MQFMLPAFLAFLLKNICIGNNSKNEMFDELSRMHTRRVINDVNPMAALKNVTSFMNGPLGTTKICIVQ